MRIRVPITIQDPKLTRLEGLERIKERPYVDEDDGKALHAVQHQVHAGDGGRHVVALLAVQGSGYGCASR